MKTNGESVRYVIQVATFSIFIFVLVLSPPGGVCEGFMSREFRDENGELQKSGSHNQSVQELAKYGCTFTVLQLTYM